MKICWWTPGPTSHQTALVTALRQLGHDVEVCYFHGKYGEGRRKLGWRDPELHGWEHYVTGRSAARKAVPDFQERVQMVPTFFNLTSWKLILWCVWRRRPWFSITEGTRGRWFMKPLFRLFCWFVDRFAIHHFAEGGTYTRQQFVDGGVRAEKVSQFAYATMRPPGKKFDVSGLKFDVEKNPEPQTPNLKPQTPNLKPSPPHEAGTVFVFAGEFCARKAVDVIAAAWKRLQPEFPSARLVLAGGGKLVGLFEGLPGVDYVGAVRQEDIYDVIMRGDVMLLPSRYDAWGAALAEGAMAGLAMVGSDRTGAADLLIEDGVNGYKVKAGDVDDLVRVMRLYAADRELAGKHGAKAKVSTEWTSGENLAKIVTEGLVGGYDL